MSVSQAIASQIPYLRRFARALTASQAGGDAYVLATLEAIVADPNIFAAAGDVRTALYRFFLKVWDSMPVNGHVDQAGFSCDELGACRSLETISLRPRIAFLLSAIEGFATAEVADTLECSVAEASSLIDAAGREIADQIRTDVLIIEDEPFIALGLEILVAELGHRTVCVARTHREAVKAARRERPGLPTSTKFRRRRRSCPRRCQACCCKQLGPLWKSRATINRSRPCDRRHRPRLCLMVIYQHSQK